MSFQHIVLFSFPNELTADQDARLRAMVASWPERIGLMTRCRLGTDLTGERNRGYRYLLYTEFPDAGVMATYQAHPVHQEFLAFVTELGCAPLVFDYHLTPATVLMPEA
jgi:hypothetical protein